MKKINKNFTERFTRGRGVWGEVRWRAVGGGNIAINSSHNNSLVIIHPFIEHD